MLKLEFNSIEEMQEFFFKDERDFELIYTNTYQCIEEAIDNKEDSTILVEITFKNKRDKVHMENKYEDFGHTLNTCLKYFESTEDYDKCKEISTVIEKLNKTKQCQKKN
jgi:hypothetical protein